MKIVDARGLQHPEPFERAVEALIELALGDQPKLIIHQEPRPLYRLLERNAAPTRRRVSPTGVSRS